MHSVTWTDMNVLDLSEDLKPPTSYEFNFTASLSLYSYLLPYCFITVPHLWFIFFNFVVSKQVSKYVVVVMSSLLGNGPGMHYKSL